MLHVLAQFRRLMALCIKGPGGKISLALFALVVGLDLLSVYVTVLIIDWTKAFYSALEAMDGAGAVWQVGVFFVIVAANSVRHLITQFFRKRLEMRWRQRLTEGALDIWLQNKAYWHLANTTFANWGDTTRGPRGVGIDNPDQRIADDCRLFVQGIMSEALDLIGRVVGLFSYLAILWNLAQFPLSLGFIGLPIEIPHYMIWAAFLYVALSSLLTHALGYPLKGLVVEQQRREANFRFALARLRTNFDEVALSAGEKAERSVLDKRFTAIVGNWKKLVNRELILASFTFPFNHSVLRIPLFVALPGYLAGHVAFGGLMQLSTAFSSVVTTLSWFIFSYRDLADLVAASSRLDNFLQAAQRAGATANSLSPVVSNDEDLHVEQLALRTPDARPLLTLPGLSIHRGEAVWLSGASGLGKTTFLKALAGIWSFGEGLVRAPQARMLFLPQKAYFPIGDAYSAMAYPRDTAEFDRGELDRVLELVGMSGHAGVDFGRNDTMTGHGLSGGEQQRLALARLILQKPDWAMLDEPTSALDGAAEAELFALVRRELPQTTLVIVAHRPPQGIAGLRRVDLDHPNTPTTGLQPA